MCCKNQFHAYRDTYRIACHVMYTYRIVMIRIDTPLNMTVKETRNRLRRSVQRKTSDKAKDRTRKQELLKHTH